MQKKRKADTPDYWRRSLCMSVIAILFACLACAKPALADTRSLEKDLSRDMFCGLYSLWAAMGVLGVDIQFDELVKPEYVDAKKGSRVLQLQHAAESYGLYAAAMKGLTPAVLRNSNHPVILHVKRNTTDARQDHYELFLGTKDGKAILYDAPHPYRLEAFGKLMSRWDGIGLVLAAEPINMRALLLPAWLHRMLCIFVAIGIVGAYHWGAKKHLLRAGHLSGGLRVISVVGGAGVLAVLALAISLMFHVFSEGGFLANATTVKSFQIANIASLIEKLDSTQLKNSLNSDAVLIDTRKSSDFKSGHIEGAISIPVDTDLDELRDMLAGVKGNTRIITYCKSRQCSYAMLVAKKLAVAGYDNISLYSGGWDEWRQVNGQGDDNDVRKKL